MIIIDLIKKCWKENGWKSIFIVTCLPCFGYTSFVAFMPLVLLSSIMSFAIAMAVALMTVGRPEQGGGSNTPSFANVFHIIINIIKNVATNQKLQKLLQIGGTQVGQPFNIQPQLGQHFPQQQPQQQQYQQQQYQQTQQSPPQYPYNNLVQGQPLGIPPQQPQQQQPQQQQPQYQQQQPQYQPQYQQPQQHQYQQQDHQQQDQEQDQDQDEQDQDVGSTFSLKGNKISNSPVVNFLGTSVIVPLLFTVIYPVMWTCGMVFMLNLRKNYILKKLKADPNKTPGSAIDQEIMELENLTIRKIFEECKWMGLIMFGISIILFGLYYLIDPILDILSSLPFFIIPPPIPMIFDVIKMIKQNIEYYFTPNSMRLLVITGGYGLIPILPLIPPNVVISMVMFTRVCKNLGLDNYKHDSPIYDIEEKWKESSIF